MWIVLWLFLFRSTPSTFPLGQSTFRGLFLGVPSLNRLHSEIDQIHLSIEALCGPARLPMGDCHRNSTPLAKRVLQWCHFYEKGYYLDKWYPLEYYFYEKCPCPEGALFFPQTWLLRKIECPFEKRVPFVAILPQGYCFSTLFPLSVVPPQRVEPFFF